MVCIPALYSGLLSFFGHKVHAVRTRLQHVDSLLQQSGAAGVIKLRSTLECPQRRKISLAYVFLANFSGSEDIASCFSLLQCLDPISGSAHWCALRPSLHILAKN